MKKLISVVTIAVLLSLTVPTKAKTQSACVNLANACARAQQVAAAYWGYCWWTGGEGYWCDKAQELEDVADDCYESLFDLCYVI